MSDTLDIYETEQGEPHGITIKDSTNSDVVITWAIAADTTIEIKDPSDVVILTITNSTFSISSPLITWTPTDAQIALLSKDIVYAGFVHLRDNGNNRERVATFNLRLLDS